MAAKRKTRTKPGRRRPAHSSLRQAAQFGTVSEVQAMLAAGAHPDELDFTTPLCIACYHKKLPIVRALLEAGASPSLAGPTGSAPLVNAVQSKSKRTLEMVKLLLAAGADPNPPAYRGMTLIEWCRRDARLDAVRALLEAAVAKRT